MTAIMLQTNRIIAYIVRIMKWNSNGRTAVQMASYVICYTIVDRTENQKKSYEEIWATAKSVMCTRSKR
jgi:hypothetical protein